MKIILVNGTEISLLSFVYRLKDNMHADRSTLTLEFSADEGLDRLDTLFSAENCEKIIITEGDTWTDVYDAYTIRVILSKETVEVPAVAVDGKAVYESRIIVTMAQRTCSESLTETVE